MDRVTDEQLKEASNGIHRGFHGHYNELLARVVFELMEARGLIETCHLCGKPAQLKPCEGKPCK